MYYLVVFILCMFLLDYLYIKLEFKKVKHKNARVIDNIKFTSMLEKKDVS